MPKGKLIDEHVSEQQCKLAVDALLSHALKVQEKKAENVLLPGKEQNVWLVVTTKQMHPEKKLKPAKIPIAHPLVDPRVSSVCLITKDPQREYKDLLEANSIRFISRVVGITKLKGKFKPFEARRMLLKENDLFLADERVVPLLPGLLGKKFFEAKKQPIPVCLTRKDLKGELERAISSTYFHQNQGTCTSVKIGTLSQKPSQVLDNLKLALPAVVKHVKGEWDNVQSFHIKTNSSASLPIWSCNLGIEQGARWDGLAASASSDEGSEGEDESEEKDEDEEKEIESDEEEEAQPPKAKGKKRAMEETPSKPKTLTKADADEAVAASAPKAKGKKRAAEAEAEAPQKKAKAGPADSVVSQRKGKGRDVGATATSAAFEKPPQKKRKSAAPTVTETPTPAPSTPSVAKRKKARAATVDFFEDGADATAASPTVKAPPNTPATGLTAATPSGSSKKAKNQAVPVTPLKSAIAKLVDEDDGAEADGATPARKKQKGKKQKKAAEAPAAAESESAPAALAETKPNAITTLTKGDLKKKRLAAAGEKKKEKVVSGAPAAKTKSAKVAIVGKKASVAFTV